MNKAKKKFYKLHVMQRPIYFITRTCVINLAIIFIFTPASAQLSKPDLNLVTYFSDLSGVKIQNFSSDSTYISVNDIFLNGKKVARTERIKNGTWYSQGVQQKILDPDYLREGILKRISMEDAPISHIRLGNKIVASYAKEGNCAAFISGHKLRVGRGFDNDPGYIDTIVYFFGCGVLQRPVEDVIRGISDISAAEYSSIVARLNKNEAPMAHSPTQKSRNEEKQPSKGTPSTEQQRTQAPSSGAESSRVRERLEALDKLLKSGLITEEEASEKRREILSEL